MKQLALNLPARPAYGRGDFFVSDANAAALHRIEAWPEWPHPVLIVHGPPGSGKTHLTHLWRAHAAAILFAGETIGDAERARIIERGATNIAVDAADQAPEQALLHLFNACIETGGYLLLTSRQSPGCWRTTLPDLGSRLRAVPAIGIGPPDDALLAAVLVKHFADRQLRVGAEVVAYLVSRMERSLAAAAEIAAALDQAALSRQSAITTRLAGAIIDGRGAQPQSDNAAGIT
jgi:chromosomal replication initiation ATPase DnaA